LEDVAVDVRITVKLILKM